MVPAALQSRKGVISMLYSLKFWEAVAYLIAGALGLLAFFGVIPANYALEAVAVLAIVKSVLKFFGIDPKVRASLF